MTHDYTRHPFGAQIWLGPLNDKNLKRERSAWATCRISQEEKILDADRNSHVNLPPEDAGACRAMGETV